MAVDDINAQLRQLDEELTATEKAIGSEWRSVTPKWWFPIGPVNIQGAMTTKVITWLYVGFNAACFVAGIVLIFFGGVPAAAGVALIVGALFSFGTLMSQFWAVTLQRELELWFRVFGEARVSKIKALGDRRTELMQHIDRLRQSDSGGQATSQPDK